MPFHCKVGDSIFINDGGGGHRYVVITNRNNNNCVVLVNFTEATGSTCDTTIFTNIDAKELFEKPTIVSYRRAKILPVSNLQKEINRKDTVSAYRAYPRAIVGKIIEDAFKSKFTPGLIINELKEHYPQEYSRYHPSQ
jgi:hypothetical protein